jgi:glycosyltransferase involved in cell wall biosynthesis
MSENYNGPDPPLAIATILRGDGITGVDTHIQQVRRYLDRHGASSTLITPFSWGRLLTYPVFGLRRLLVEHLNKAAGVAWYLRWHEIFVRHALRRHLENAGACVIYAQDPPTARAALRTRRGPHQRVVMAVHLRISMADEWADKKQIRRGGSVYRAIRRMEADAIPRVDGLVYVSRWGREALLSWLPEAAAVPSAVIGNFVTPAARDPNADTEPLGDLVTIGNLDLVKNHRFLVEVVAEARRAGRFLTLDIFGDGPCRKDLVRQVSSLGLEQQVRFRGYVSDARTWLPRYLVYVHASYSESLPLAIIEAMAAGLPVITANTGGIAELCDDGVEARFWSLDDPALAAAALLDLLEREPDRLKAAKAASERFRRDFDVDVIGPRLRSFLLNRG